MAKLSAGILVFRKSPKFEMFLVHPGGPFWAKKDNGSWSLPKGEYANSEVPLDAARREFKEETGQSAPAGEYLELGQVAYSNKKLTAWAVQGDVNAQKVKSNVFLMEWPPKSGMQQEFPEVDKGAWFAPRKAKAKLVKGQAELVDRLLALIGEQQDETEGEQNQMSLFS